MNKLLLILLLVIVLPLHSFCQDTKEKKEEALDKVSTDSIGILRYLGQKACHCIDSVDKIKKDKDKKVAAFSNCIDLYAETYQLAIKLLHTSKNSNQQISFNVNKKSAGYKHYYYDIERWLKDSCAELNQAMQINDDQKEKSLTKNPEAAVAYNNGLDLMGKEDYATAIPFFEKAVSIDPEFVFAWDNLGVCYRRTENYEKALAAYQASLKIDSTGKAALQNVPLVYQLQKKNDEAIAAYNTFLHYYPGDPEVYYGIGVIYYSGKNDLENALTNMCKAYNIYADLKSPYRGDAEKVINLIHMQMKRDGKEDVFYRILKENNIKSN